MGSRGTWWARLGGLLGGVALAVVVPVAAWASSGPGQLVLEVARPRPRRGVGGFFAALCCLFVVGIVVLLVLLVVRRRGRPPRR
ncbi:hypothetical protein SAMN05444365_101253 [Micromonospora pattaloongensis]|uniref:Uncharacterized protein n=1 Tax=Micromonospora pattaloongensis TaxID=405436 RepID=A0A1H3G263_9ACTN|nr:hypothetical protein [Micromonospora pattaloongensis]SDX97393.1 hypothetical protein SAMN05444365_101253 [Micromonospora pattaloongensis]